MERYREGRPLPAVLPNNVMYDETLLSMTGQSNIVHPNAAWGPHPGTNTELCLSFFCPLISFIFIRCSIFSFFEIRIWTPATCGHRSVNGTTNSRTEAPNKCYCFKG